MTDQGSASPEAAACREAHALIEKGDGRKAQQICAKLLKANPRSAPALNLAGTIELRKGNPRGAFEMFRNAMTVDPDNAEYHANIGHTLAIGGKFQPAEKALRNAIAMDPNLPRAHHDLGGVLLQTERAKEALTVFTDAVCVAPTESWPHANAGIAHQALGNMDEAVAAYRAALAIDPKDENTWVNLGSALAGSEDYTSAIEAYTQATTLNPKRLDAFRAIASISMTGGEYTRAVPALRRAIALDNTDKQSRVSLGYALTYVGEAAEAKKICQDIVAKAPRLIIPRTNLAFACLRNREPDKALEACAGALELEPANTAALAYRYAALNELGRRDEAAEILGLDTLVTTHVFDKAGDAYPSIDDFNAAFVAHIQDNPTLAYSEDNRTLNAGQSTRIFSDTSAPITDVFMQMIGGAIEDYKANLPKGSDHPFLARTPPKDYRIEVWANIMDASGFHDTHFHPTGWLSGVYYPQLPSVVSDDDPNHEGWIEFGRAHHAIESPDEPTVRFVRPKEGLVVLFPSYMGHRTIPCNSDEKRVSVAFDVVRA